MLVLVLVARYAFRINFVDGDYAIAYTFFYRKLDFSSEPGVANEILENEPKSCLTVACFRLDFCTI